MTTSTPATAAARLGQQEGTRTSNTPDAIIDRGVSLLQQQEQQPPQETTLTLEKKIPEERELSLVLKALETYDEEYQGLQSHEKQLVGWLERLKNEEQLLVQALTHVPMADNTATPTTTTRTTTRQPAPTTRNRQAIQRLEQMLMQDDDDDDDDDSSSTSFSCE